MTCTICRLAISHFDEWTRFNANEVAHWSCAQIVGVDLTRYEAERALARRLQEVLRAT